MIRILDRLMLSDLSEANDPFYLQRHDIQAIVYFGDGGMFPDDIKLFHKSADGAKGTLTAAQLRDGITFLRESLRSGRRVLAVGRNGATIVASYLTEMGFSPAQARQMFAEEGVPLPDEETVRTYATELQKRAAVTLGHRD